MTQNTERRQNSTIIALKKITSALKSVSPDRRAAITHLALIDAQEPKEPCPCTQNKPSTPDEGASNPEQSELPL